MKIDDVNNLIKNEKIVACNFKSFRGLIYEKSNNDQSVDCIISEKPFSDCKLNDGITFLYKIDGTHYIEYYSQKIVTVVNKTQGCIVNFSLEDIQKSQVVINENDLIKIDTSIKNKFSQNDSIKDKIFDRFVSNFDAVRSYIMAALKQGDYINKICKEFENKKDTFLVKLSDLKTISISTNEEESYCKHRFIINDVSSYSLNPYTIITKVENEKNLFQEYFTGRKLLIDNTFRLNSSKRYVRYGTFESDLVLYREYPVIATNPIPFDEKSKHYISESIIYEEDVKRIIDAIFTDAIYYINGSYELTKKVDEKDAYVDNALVDLMLRFKNNKIDEQK